LQAAPPKKKKEEKVAVMELPKATRIKDVVRALNTLGVKPRDLVDILQAMKAAGALHAELALM
jgi:flagellar P-ring protein precursor FlgI